MSAVAHTPAAFVHAILAGYRKYGLNPAPTLAHAHLAADSLRDPCTPIATAQFERFMELSMRQMDDEALGWFSRPLWWGSYGLLARASVTAANLRVALKRWCRNHNLLTRDIRLRMTESAGVATVAITEHRDLGEQREFCLVSILRNVLGYSSWLVDSRIVCVDVGFPFARPVHHAVYPGMFPGPIRFHGPHASASFDAAYLDLPVRRDEAATRAMLGNALPLLVEQYRRDRLLVQRLRAILITRPQDVHNAQTLADALNLSVRTLYRQLEEDSMSLQSLKDDVRKEQAQQLLLRSALPVKQIAASLGFCDEKSFARAFRRWFGTTPFRYRRNPD